MNFDLQRPAVVLLAVWVLFTNIASAREPGQVLSTGDSTSVRMVLERYRTSWLANDESGVLSTFAQDAVLMPAHGSLPIVGMTAIKQYWWPESATKTTITKFVQNLDEVGGNQTLAYARGSSDVEWRTESKGTAETWQNGSSYLFLLKRQADGTWLISHLIWDAAENRLVK